MTDIVLEKQSLLAQCFYLAFLWITAFGLNEKKCFLKILPITLLRKKLPLRKGSNIAVFRNAVAQWHLIQNESATKCSIVVKCIFGRPIQNSSKWPIVLVVTVSHCSRALALGVGGQEVSITL